MSRTRKILLAVVAGVGTSVLALGVVGSARTTGVIKVTRETTATPEAIWDLWADVPRRSRWDEGLEWIRINGPFEAGATGEIKVTDQSPRQFVIIEAVPNNRYTDRFFLPLGTSMDWHHSIHELGDGRRQVSFRIETTGPTSLILAPVLNNILETELPQTVDTLIKLAEQPEPSLPFAAHRALPSCADRFRSLRSSTTHRADGRYADGPGQGYFAERWPLSRG